MNVAEISEKQIARDTVRMTLLSLAMQTGGMLFNVVLSRKAGTAAVGLMSLIFSLFGFIMVLANGNILISTARFISEARGAGHRNFCGIMRYSFSFCCALSLFFGAAFFLAAEPIGINMLKSRQLVLAIRIISLSLPFASAGSCIKGFFHGIRRVEIPMKGDLIEFCVKWSVLFSGLLIFGGTDYFYCAVAVSILLGEMVSFIFYLGKYRNEYAVFRTMELCGASLLTDSPSGYLKSTFPIVLSGYTQMLLSTANELLVPAALLRFSMSTEQALADYGMFEAIIIPAIFFPSALLTSLSGIIVPEAALANRCRGECRRERLQKLTDSAFVKTISYSMFIAAVFLYIGAPVGNVLCPADDLVSWSIVRLAPVIPFIYMEIILESLLKGMGRQNFLTVVALCEYAVRIACVIIFVGRIGFDGVLISYYASNIISNIIRMIAVCREAQLSFSVCRYIVFPLLKGLICCEAGRLAVNLSHAEYSGSFAVSMVFIFTAVTVFAFMSYKRKSYAAAEQTEKNGCTA